MRKFVALVLIPLVFASGCGGGGGHGGGGGGNPPPPPPTQTIATPGPPNVETLTVDAGPAGLTTAAANTAFVSINVCVPNTNNCQLVDHIEVDTGSIGLRILADTPLNLTLPAVLDASNRPLAECLAFADGSSWGALATADIQLPVSGEIASGVRVHIIGAAAAGSPPAACVPAPPLKTENTVASFGANGILGVGPFINDCNSSGNCAPGPQSANYYTCASTPCVATTATLAEQLPNPVTLFGTDSNGVIVELPPVVDAGSASASGSLVFGIGTRTNNALGGATTLTGNPASGVISATINGATYNNAYLDSGSNANFFTSTLTVCASPNDGFYCPASTTNESATLQGASSATLAADFKVANADTMFANATFTAFPDLAGPNSDPTSFDLGLAFFYGRNVFTGFENPATSAGPFFAY